MSICRASGASRWGLTTAGLADAGTGWGPGGSSAMRTYVARDISPLISTTWLCRVGIGTPYGTGDSVGLVGITQATGGAGLSCLDEWASRPHIEMGEDHERWE